MGGRPAGAHAHDPALLLEVRARGSVDRPAVREHGPGSSGTRGSVVGRGVWRAEELHRALWWVSANAGTAHGQGDHGGAAGALGDAPPSVGRRSWTSEGSGMESGVRRVPRMGLAPGAREFAARCETARAHAGATMVVGLRRNAGIASIGSRTDGRGNRGTDA